MNRRSRYVLSLAACLIVLVAPTVGRSDGALPEAIGGGGQGEPIARFDIPRERRWLRLRGWLRGEDVDREPTMLLNMDDPFLVAAGGELFGMYCVNCHGAQGRGDGPRAKALDPRPRDLTAGVFKFRSTPSGEPPTPEDLFRTISGGLRGTGMLPFADLPELQRWAIVAQVFKLADTLPGGFELGPVEVPEPLAAIDSADRLKRGEGLYSALGCDKCHGTTGRGDGPAALEQVDANGEPIMPRDFVTQPFKRGDDVVDTYRTIVTGLDGTPMPGYADAVTPTDVWDLVAFLRAMPKQGRARVSALELAEARALIGNQERQGAHTVVSRCGCRAGG